MSEPFIQPRTFARPSSLMEENEDRVSKAKTCKSCDQCRNRKVRCVSTLSTPWVSGNDPEVMVAIRLVAPGQRSRCTHCIVRW